MSAQLKREQLPAEVAKTMRRDLGFWLKQQREEAGITQAELAARLGFKYYSFISQVESGACRIPQETYEGWADAISVNRKTFAKTVLQHLEPGLFRILYK